LVVEDGPFVTMLSRRYPDRFGYAFFTAGPDDANPTSTTTMGKIAVTSFQVLSGFGSA
jgi:hypothetical protein